MSKAQAIIIISRATAWSYLQGGGISLRGQDGTIVVWEGSPSQMNPTWLTPENSAWPTCMAGKPIWGTGRAEAAALVAGEATHLTSQDLHRAQDQANAWLSI